jgi:hypothetical protein
VESPERYEQLIAFLESHLPEPVSREEDSGGVRFLGGEPPEVVVELTESIVVVSEFAGEWEGEFRFVVKPRRVGVVHWEHLPETPLLDAVAALLKGARQARQDRFQTCQQCGTYSAPEWLHEDGVCHSCATRSGSIH